jgi:hypothetical protein
MPSSPSTPSGPVTADAEQSSEPNPSEESREQLIEALQQADSNWTVPNEPLDFGGSTRWTPDLTKQGSLLHLSMTGELPGAWSRRMTAAVEAGFNVTFATTASSLDIDVLLTLQRLDARIQRVDLTSGGPRVRALRSVADLVASERLFLDPVSLRALAQARLDEALASEHNAKKGRWFEEALCLVFSQVSWLTVDEHSYNNASEEIDLLLACRAVSGYITGLVGGPIVLATAKNERKATNSATVKYLKEQMANRKGRCKLGFLCSASTISDEARTEILRGSQQGDAVIACVDGSDLQALIDGAETLDALVEDLIRKAVAD